MKVKDIVEKIDYPDDVEVTIYSYLLEDNVYQGFEVPESLYDEEVQGIEIPEKNAIMLNIK